MLFSLTNPEVAILMMGLFLFAVLLGFPIAFTLMAMGALASSPTASSVLSIALSTVVKAWRNRAHTSLAMHVTNGYK